MQFIITPFEPVHASDSEMAEHHAVALAVLRAQSPRLPEYTFEVHKAFMRTGMTVWGPRRCWVARHEGRIVGTAVLDLPDRESPDTAIAQVRVLPETRRRGIGTALLRETLPTCRAEGRDTVVAYSIPAGGVGEAWTRSLGFTKVAEWVRQTLRIPGADPALWQVPQPDGFRIMRWSGAAPQEVVAGFARARTAMRDAPTGESSLAWPDWTVERVRQYEADAVKRGCELQTAVIIHEATGRVVGLTEMEIQDGQSETVLQQDTAVVPDYRGQGLGRLVKAAMMRWLTAERPEVTHIVTSTAADNTHMIRVNLQLGYSTDVTRINLEAALEPLQRSLTS